MKITLCGSARFERFYKAWNQALSLSEHVVYALTAYPSDFGGRKDWYTEEDKVILDKVHLGKIENSEAVLILNVFGYIGESTLRELFFAKKTGKKIFCLESWAEGYGVVPRNYSDWYLKNKTDLGIDINAVSPVDTTLYEHPWNLLPPPGERRSRIVEFLENAGKGIR